jgi:F-type H+-transporting ATPase subunit a
LLTLIKDVHLHQISENKILDMVLYNKSLQFIVVILFACLPLFTFANPTDTLHVSHESHEVAVKENKVVDEKAEIKAQIEEVKNHHVLDGHDFSLFGDAETGAHYGFPLPIILWDNGLQLFSSSKFHHGEIAAESNGNYYRLHHERIYKVSNATEKLSLDHHGHPTNIQPLDFSITEFNSYFFMLCKLKFQCLRFYFIYLSCFIQYFFEIYTIY